MTSQDSDATRVTHDTQDSTWDKVVVHEPQDSSQKVTVTTVSTKTLEFEEDGGNESDPEESTTETAIIHHSNTNTAIFNDYPSTRSISPKKYGSQEPQQQQQQAGGTTTSSLKEPTHKKSQSSVYTALDSFVAGGTLQESLKNELLKLFEEEFKSEFISKNEQIESLSKEKTMIEHQFNELQTKYQSLHSKSTQLAKKFENIQKLANDKQNVMEKICDKLNIEFNDSETVEQLGERIKEAMRSDHNTSGMGRRDSIENDNTYNVNESQFQYTGMFLGLVAGLVIGFVLRDKDVVSMVIDKVSNANSGPSS